MKNVKILLGGLLMLFMAFSCSTPNGIDEDLSFLGSSVSANHNGILSISTDNSGLVVITPVGEGVSSAKVTYGHGSATPVTLKPGLSTSHNYPEGSYTVGVNYYDIAGRETVKTYPLQLIYVAPANVTTTRNLDGPIMTLTAKADFANGFQVKWGDGGTNETPTNMTGSLGGTFTVAPHTYAPGNYTLTVIALSGGAAKTTVTYPVTVFAPFSLPITYENPIQNYNIGGTFGDVKVEQIPNPFMDGINTSATVRKYTKANGAPGWGGTWTPMSEPAGVPIDMNKGSKIKVMVYATESGKSLNVELEQASGGLANQVIKVPVSKANEWVELTFDFGALGVPAGTTFKQLVFRYNDSSDGAGEVIYLDNISQSN
ncbi:MAG: hypothetical protein IPH57_16835 [Saprospiraceae bacterium]|nr:hypothetical protein [Saprospiraceae bacterium]